ncbi:MAG: LysM peptidoglycan-binding domain-containing protein [Anaerolineae bacterium]|nr:LysM peptidoglycan-binding domain-containing protein [Anaerolineae bacterium]
MSSLFQSVVFYIDNASLVVATFSASTVVVPAQSVVNQPSATPEPAPVPTALPTSTPTTTSPVGSASFSPGPIPAGATVYVAQSGDSLSLMASKHALSLAQFRVLNEGRIRPNDIVWVGDKFIVKMPDSANP